MYSYKAYGLRFASEIELPEFVPASESIQRDVTIQLGEVPTSLGSETCKDILYEATPHQFLLKLDRIAHYLVQDGNSITIQLREAAVPSDIRVFLLGSCLGALLHQRGILALHASAVKIGEGAVLFMGPSGNGKSTLLNALLKRGHKMLADDITAIELDDRQESHVIPGFPRTKLWLDAAQTLQIDVTKLEPTRPKLKKYEYHVPDQFESAPMGINAIYELTVSNHELSIQTMPQMRIIQALVRNTYRHKFLDGLAKRGTHFELLTKIAQRVPVARVKRPRETYHLDALVELILEDLDNRNQEVSDRHVSSV
ncbi:MAG: hypothetical protein AAF702_40155 [Chloroflexota bacterium]